jgi:hypothetical protein
MEKMFQSAQIRLRFIQSKLDLEGWNPELYPLFASKQVSEDVRRQMQLGSTRICRHNRPSTTFSTYRHSALLLVVFSGNRSRSPLEYVAGNLAGNPCNSGHLPNVFLYSQCRGRVNNGGGNRQSSPATPLAMVTLRYGVIDFSFA